MADEQKTYLINFESNLDIYTKEAAEAKKKVDELNKSNEELKKSGTASGEEIEKSNAALRNAQKEYSQAKKLVDLQTTANNSNTESRKQLAAIVAIEQQRLGKLANQYVINDKGQRELSQSYKDAVVKVNNAKKAIIEYDKAQSDGKSSIGLYSEAIEGAMSKFSSMPGPIGKVGSSISDFAGKLKMLGPIGTAAFGAILAFSAPLIAFFTKSEKGVELLERKVAGLKAAFGALTGELIEVGDKMSSVVSEEQSSKWTKLLGAIGSMLGPLGVSFASIGVKMDMASNAAEKYTGKLQELQDLERGMIVPRAQANNEIVKAKLLYEDEAVSIKTRMDALKTSLEVEIETTNKEIDHQDKVIEQIKVINLEKKKAGQLRDEDDKKLQEAIAKRIDLETDSMVKQRKLQTTLNSAQAKFDQEELNKIKEQNEAKKALRDEEIAIRLAEAKGDTVKLREALKYQYDELAKQTDISEGQRRLMKILYDQAIADLDKADKEKLLKQDADLAKQSQDFKARDDAAFFEYSRNAAQGNIDQLIEIENAEWENFKRTAEFKNATISEQMLWDQQYTQSVKDLANARGDIREKELQVVSGFFGAMSDLMGESTAASKGFAVAETLINTYMSATKAYNALSGITVVGPVLGAIAAAAAVVAGLVNVKKILAVKVPKSKGGRGSSISGGSSMSAAAAHVTSKPLAATTLNTTTNPQSVKEKSENASLTADAIAQAMSKVPPPIVTVEDINAKTTEVKKVSVKATV